MFTGDIIHHPLQLADPELRQAGDSDPDQAAATRRWLCESYADQDVIVLTGHFGDPTSGRIVRAGDAYRFEWLDAM